MDKSRFSGEITSGDAVDRLGIVQFEKEEEAPTPSDIFNEAFAPNPPMRAPARTSVKCENEIDELSDGPVPGALMEVEPTSRPLTCVDLFAGAGGFSLAAQKCGITVIAAVEKDPHAANTYRANFCGSSNFPCLYETDVMDFDLLPKLQKHFSGKICDLVLGGPPCQGFSQHRIRNSGIGDPRNQLILKYFEVVAALAPKAFLMENVPGILWPRHKAYLEEFYAQGRNAKYHVFQPVVLDARNFGVPQRRKRVFILGIRDDIDIDSIRWPPLPTHGNSESRKKQPNLKPWMVARSIFEKPVNPDDKNNIHMNHSPALVEVFKSTPPNGGSRSESNRVLPCHEGHDGHRDVYGRIDPSKPAPTMTTACVNPSKGRFVHPTENHGITLRQAARFQTFPDDFSFIGGLMAGARQIGNAVPIQLGIILLNAVSAMLANSGTREESGNG